MYNGIINVHKEAGFTSHDVVAKMRGILKQKKIGHTGTLDPQATGVLPVCLGTGTKLCDMLAEHDKEYVAELLLGVVTDTQDMTGEVLEKREVRLTGEEVRDAVYSFVGDYDQVPPMYSALKVNGKKLYELARAGKEVERKPRRVRIGEIEILKMELPVVRMRVVCSKGTYIRTLCADIGEKLNVGGAMQSLVRTRVGRFCLEDAVTLDKLERLKEEEGLETVITGVEDVFAGLPEVRTQPAYDVLLENGNAVSAAQVTAGAETHGDVRMKKSDGSFVGVYAWDERTGRWKPVKMFLER